MDNSAGENIGHHAAEADDGWTAPRQTGVYNDDVHLIPTYVLQETTLSFHGALVELSRLMLAPAGGGSPPPPSP